MPSVDWVNQAPSPPPHHGGPGDSEVGGGSWELHVHCLHRLCWTLGVGPRWPPRAGPASLTPAAGPYIVYMLQEVDILEDWTAIKKARAAVSPQKRKADGP